MSQFETFSQKIRYFCEENDKPVKLYRGPLILFEGVDLSGKGTVISAIKQMFGTNLRLVAEPTRRSLLRDHIFNAQNLFDDEQVFDDIKEYINYYMIMASRAYSLYICFEEMFKKNAVLLDRSFVSTMVYQENSFERDKILHDNVLLYSEISYKFDFLDVVSAPDLVFFLDIYDETYYNRVGRLDNERNNFDSLDKRVVSNRINSYRNIFDYLTKSEVLSSKIVTVDSNGPIDNTVSIVAKHISQYLSGISNFN